MADAELIFKAMADRTRQRLLRVLSIGELSVNDLVEVLDQPQSTLSRHLQVLRGAGLLLDRRLGTTVMYSVQLPSQTISAGDADGLRGGPNGLRPNKALRDWLLDWIESEQLESPIKSRLRRVVARRDSEGTEFFDSVGARWDQLREAAFGGVFHMEALTALLPANWTVADVGCGTGYLLGTLSARFARVIAVDPSAKMLVAARGRPELASAKNVDFREGSLSDLPIGNCEVDLVIASLVLHHTAQPLEALSELYRCLVDGGRLLIVEQQEHDNQVFRDRMGDQWWGFSADSLSQWAVKAGFSDIGVLELSSVSPANRDFGRVPGLFGLTGRRVKAKPRRAAGARKVGKSGRPKARQVDVAEVKERMRAVKSAKAGVETGMDVHLL
ncbi:MAG: ArsR/SmtB family transcription factor [Planctomycetota bacterium]|jgi:ArsR family transcriptional regulator